MAGINKDEVAAAMARIKALQDMLSGKPAAEEEEEEYDPNDPNQNYQETEEDEKWREEQEKEWERQQAIEKENAAKEAAAAAASPAPDAAASAPVAAVSSSSSSSTAPAAAPAAAASAIGPHQWTTAQLTSWLKEVQADVKKRGEIFEKKGWTKDEVAKWTGEVDSSFSAASAKATSLNLTGATAASWDISSDKAWGEHLAVSNAYHRAAIWASWKQQLRNFQQANNKAS